VGASGSVIAAAGLSPTNENIVLWDTLAPPTSSRAAVHCHDGGARCLAVIDSAAGGGYPLIVSGGRAGDVIVHDFRYVASGRGGHRATGNGHSVADGSPGGQARRPPVGSNREGRGGVDLGGSTSDRTVWSIPRAHPGGVHTIESVPGTSMFLTGGKDGEVKLWDAASSRLVRTWERAHDKRTFLNARGGGAVMQVAVTLVLPLQDGMLSCGADGIVKLYPQQEIAFAKSSA
jgi:WD40 repeat protein